MTSSCGPAHTRLGPDTTSPVPGPSRVRTRVQEENGVMNVDAAPPLGASVLDAASDALHIPVLADRVLNLLRPALQDRHAVLIDATLGLGGHTERFLAAFPQLHIIGLDRDPQALAAATARISRAGYADRLTAVHCVYDELRSALAQAGPALAALGRSADGTVDGILFDLGVSSWQLDDADRGFAYAVDAPLDMRMDQTSGITAAQVLADYDEVSIARVLRDYGEERFASRIAARIVQHRATAPITSSGQLTELIRAAIPAAARGTGHPAKRTFQALRIEVNDELGALRRALPAALDALAVGGRIVVMSYQSLEDRIVKRAIAPLTESTTPPDLPVELPGHEPQFAWLGRKSQRPTEQEIAENPRAASARLRAAERMRVQV